MSIQALNILFNNTSNSGVLKWLFDGSSTGVFNNTSGDYVSINTVGYSYPDYTGVVIGKSGELDSYSAAGLLINNGLQFYGGSGNFSQSIEVMNSEYLFTGQGFSLFFELEKSVSGTTRPFDTILSNGNTNIGINASNRLFFSNGIDTSTYSKIPFGNNLWTMIYNNGYVKLGRFNPVEMFVDYDPAIKLDMQTGNRWIIGDYANSFIHINYIGWFDKPLTNYETNQICIALKSDVNSSGTSTTRSSIGSFTTPSISFNIMVGLDT